MIPGKQKNFKFGILIIPKSEIMGLNTFTQPIQPSVTESELIKNITFTLNRVWSWLIFY